jgi:hypothetical protein
MQIGSIQIEAVDVDPNLCCAASTSPELLWDRRKQRPLRTPWFSGSLGSSKSLRKTH